MSDIQTSTSIKLTLSEVLLHSDLPILFVPEELVRPRRKMRGLLHRPLMSQMSGLNTNSADESVNPAAESCIPKFHHSVCEISFLVKGRRRDIDVDHELLIGRTDGAIKASPCL